MVYATVEDVTALLGRETDAAENAQIMGWLKYAEALIRKRYPNLTQLVDDGRIPKESVCIVEAMCVARHARNPEGMTSRTTSIDDYQETQGYRNSLPTLVITDDEWLLLTPTERQHTGVGAFTITPAGHMPYTPKEVWL